MRNLHSASTLLGSGCSESAVTTFHGATRPSGGENISTVGDFGSQGASEKGFTAPPVRDVAPPPAADMTASQHPERTAPYFWGANPRTFSHFASAGTACDLRLRALEPLARDNQRPFTPRIASLVYPSSPHTSCASTCLNTYRSPPLTRTRK
jgi:hypothetical protein